MSIPKNSFVERFGAPAFDAALAADGPAVHAQMQARASVREFRGGPLPPGTLHRLCALALCSPTKSDLQQRDIVIVDAPAVRAKLVALLAEGPQGQPWIEQAPSLLVFCGNHRRQRRLHALRGIPFANDHLDAFFNATVDAAIALSAFVVAAEAEGLGTCPISTVRNHAREIAELLQLPDLVFPVAGLAVGHPARQPPAGLRLALPVTVHHNHYGDAELDAAIASYDQRRSAAQPYKNQRYLDAFGVATSYGWSDDKARQFSRPERADFGAYVRSIGFKLD